MTMEGMPCSTSMHSRTAGGDPACFLLGQINACQHAQRYGNEACQHDKHHCAGKGIGYAAARLRPWAGAGS